MALLEVTGISKKRLAVPMCCKTSLSTWKKAKALASSVLPAPAKQPLLRCLNFLETPDTGVIRVDGKTLWDCR